MLADDEVYMGEDGCVRIAIEKTGAELGAGELRASAVIPDVWVRCPDMAATERKMGELTRAMVRKIGSVAESLRCESQMFSSSLGFAHSFDVRVNIDGTCSLIVTALAGVKRTDYQRRMNALRRIASEA